MKLQIFYVGLDISTLSLLIKESDFKVTGVAKISNFKIFTLNPVNYIFKIVYFFREIDTFRGLECVFLFLWRICKFASSSVFKRYAQYLIILSTNKISVVDLENTDNFTVLEQKKIDLIIVNIWGILDEKVFRISRLKPINIHPSRLPQYRGALPTLWTLKNQDSRTALSYVVLDKKYPVDGGPIIGQYEIDVSDTDNWFSLETKIRTILIKTLTVTIRKYANGETKPIFQDNAKTSKTAGYCQYRQINWSEEKAFDIFNKINLYPFLDPDTYCFFLLGNRKIYVKQASFIEVQSGSQIGLTIQKGYLSYASTSGILKSRLFIDIDFFDSLLLLFRLTKHS